MAALAEITEAIAQLPDPDVRKLAVWLQDYLEENWDQQLAGDVAAGRLDGLIHRAEAQIAAGQVRDLDEVTLL
ncbi:MAG: hypothetical protein KME15_02445 [Drouetiella hepatica Uher 2000/2452]|uniref:Addiction module component n=1 Tax=Drouetiella hepatica Uher 2000/2452 TaxID=904376 RepID=A0A951Q708_9CYAN|nr:hypothetical protein [Drouetiella hepatica Uher 2000/2452]